LSRPRLYRDLADWWPLFAPPGYYEGEARAITATLGELGITRPRILELGSGGGSMAAHLSAAHLTLVDREETMLAVSRRCNPHAEHIRGDMRNIRLGRRFDVVLIHDAINHIVTIDDLTASLHTAQMHLAHDGLVLVAPDDTAESFRPGTSTGGQDAGKRALRYLCWTHRSCGTSYPVDFAIMLRDGENPSELTHEHYRFGLFSRDAWRAAFLQAGFSEPTIRSDRWRESVFLARAATAR
jgi:SAM-dependent methyltransferase